jgi:hypothetical protein
MHQKVAIDKNLKDVKAFFENKNFQVDLFSEYEFDTIGHVSSYDAIIIAGDKNNYPKFGYCYDKTPVIDAGSMSPEDIYNTIS